MMLSDKGRAELEALRLFYDDPDARWLLDHVLADKTTTDESIKETKAALAVFFGLPPEPSCCATDSR